MNSTAQSIQLNETGVNVINLKMTSYAQKNGNNYDSITDLSPLLDWEELDSSFVKLDLQQKTGELRINSLSMDFYDRFRIINYERKLSNGVQYYIFSTDKPVKIILRRNIENILGKGGNMVLVETTEGNEREDIMIMLL